MYSTDIRFLWYNNSCQDTHKCYHVYRTLGAVAACLGRSAQQRRRECFFLLDLPTMKNNQTRNCSYLSKWSVVIGMYGEICVYCHDQPATQIDHVIPVSWSNSNSIYNLRPSCAWCNMLASSNVFSSFDEKYEWLRIERNKRRVKRYARTVCTCCKLPFQNPLHVPSYFYCPECYDFEYETSLGKRAGWLNWLRLCESAGFIIPAHRALAEYIRTRHRTTITAQERCTILAEEYSKYEDWEIVDIPFVTHQEHSK